MNASNHQQKIRMQMNKGSLYKPQEERQGTTLATGTLFTREMLELVITCIVTIPLFVLVPLLFVRRSRRRLERRLGVAPQQQAARSRPQPKEAREEE